MSGDIALNHVLSGLVRINEVSWKNATLLKRTNIRSFRKYLFVRFEYSFQSCIIHLLFGLC